MKILITSIVDLKKTSHNRLHQFIRHLSQNHAITVLSVNDWWKTSQTDVSLYQLGVEDILRGIDIRYFTNRKLSPYLQEITSIINLNRILEEIDYTAFDVHLNYSTLLSGYFVARKLKSAGINTVYDIADDLPQMIRASPQIPSMLRPLGRIIGTVMVNTNIKISKKVTCITNSLRDSYNIPHDKFQLIPNGVDTELFKSHPSQEFRQRLGIGDTDFVAGYIGILREWVDFEPVFAAIKHVSQNRHNVKVLIVGEEGGIARVENLAEKYQISDKVIFTGTVPYTMVPEYISCMDACLIPFRDNAVSDGSLPLKLFEYMACGKPVICSRLTGIAQAVGDEVLYASDEEEYQKNLEALYNHKELREKMGVKGREFVEQSYSWASIGPKLESILDEARGVVK